MIADGEAGTVACGAGCSVVTGLAIISNRTFEKNRVACPRCNPNAAPIGLRHHKKIRTGCFSGKSGIVTAASKNSIIFKLSIAVEVQSAPIAHEDCTPETGAALTVGFTAATAAATTKAGITTKTTITVAGRAGRARIATGTTTTTAGTKATAAAPATVAAFTAVGDREATCAAGATVTAGAAAKKVITITAFATVGTVTPTGDQAF